MTDAAFTIATLNANSVRVRLEQILAWLQDRAPDVLCLQETKVQDVDFPEQAFHDAGYHVVFCGQKSYSGVAIVSRTAPEDVTCGLDDDGEPDKARLICAKVDGIPIVNTYVPQGRALDHAQFAYKMLWFERLRAFFDRHYSGDEPLIWVGDLNVAPEAIDVHNPKALAKHVDFHPQARAALQGVMDWGFVDLFRRRHPDEPGHYSYWDFRVRGAVGRNIGWRIDHVMATPAIATKSRDCWIDVEARKAERPSDHTFVVAEFDL